MEDSQDDFSNQLRYIIERGLMASPSGGAFKYHIVSLVQEYSRKIAFEGKGVSPLFLGFCDLIIEGHFARLPESALKVLVLSKVYHHDSEQSLGLIEGLSGMTLPAIEEAVNYLRKNGCLDSERKVKPNRYRRINSPNSRKKKTASARLSFSRDHPSGMIEIRAFPDRQ
jgi:hypothetical protein